MRKPLAEEIPETGFSLVVHHRDEKTGLVTHKDPYVLHEIGEPGSSEKQRLWERPRGSGNLWDKAGNPIGRWIYETKIVKGKTCRMGKYDPDAKHIIFTPPPTQDQILAQSLTEKDRKIAELEKELSSIQAETAKKTETARPQKNEKGA